jgi:hypothetical protein
LKNSRRASVSSSTWFCLGSVFLGVKSLTSQFSYIMNGANRGQVFSFEAVNIKKPGFLLVARENPVLASGGNI